MEQKIIIVKPGTLKAKDKEKLTKAGNVVVEHPEPYTVKFLEKSNGDTLTYTNCYTCGERIYMLSERLKALTASKVGYYCSHGHSSKFP